MEREKKSADVTYDIKEESVFDNMAAKLGDMSEQEKEQLLILMQGYQAGVHVGMRIANNQTA